MEHTIAVTVWNEFITKTSNKGIDFSFNDVEKRIKEVVNKTLKIEGSQLKIKQNGKKIKYSK
jgi:hypothetical protein